MSDLTHLTDDASAADSRTGSKLPAPPLHPVGSETGTFLDNRGAATHVGSDTDSGGAAELVQPTFLQPATRPDSIGRLSHYEAQAVIGRGGFGIVLKAFDEVLRRVVAVKVLAPELAVTPTARKRFLREAQAAAAVRHENIVQIHAVEESPLPFLVMEYIPGETLQDRLNRCGPLDVTDVVRIGSQVARGLAAAHEMGLVHRDVKPANVLLEQGAGEMVKLTDFGLARAADDASLTQSGAIAGTPMYMAPEQAQAGPIDHRADLFSLGSVLYVMVCGHPPFQAATTMAVLKRVCEDTPEPIREIIPGTPDWICRIIEKLHAKKPADRFQTALEVATVLADCESQLRTHSELQDFTRIPRAKRTGRRFRDGKWAAAALLTCACVIGLAAYLLSRSQTQPGMVNDDRVNSPKFVARTDNDETTPANPPVDVAQAKTVQKGAPGQSADDNPPPTEADKKIRDLYPLTVANLGIDYFGNKKYEQAEATLQEAIQLLRQAVEASPQDPLLQQKLGDGYDYLGQVFEAKRELDKAVAAHSQALAVRSKLAAKFNGEEGTVYRTQVAWSHGNLGNVCFNHGKFSQAALHQRAAIDVRAQLAAETPANERYHSKNHANFVELIWIWDRLGRALLEDDRLSEAADALQTSQLLRKQFVEGAVLPARFGPLDQHQAWIAEALALKGRITEAREVLRVNVQMFRDTNPPQLSSALLPYGRLLNQIQAWTDAESVLQECLTLRKNAKQDDEVTRQAELQLGVALLKQAKLAEAEPLLKSGYEGARRWATQIPAQERTARLTESLERLIEWSVAADKPEEKVRWEAELEVVKNSQPSPPTAENEPDKP